MSASTKISLIAITALLTVLIFGWIHYTNQIRNLEISNLIAITDSVSHYQKKINGIEKEIFEKNALILSQKDAIKAGLLEREELKKVGIRQATEITSLKALISVIRDSVQHNGQVIVVKDTAFVLPKNAILLPFSFSDKNKHLSLIGNFDKVGKLGYSLNIPVNLDIYIGYEKKRLKTVVTTTNPYVKISDMVSVKLDNPKPKKFNVGAFVGYGVNDTGLSPIIGVGVGYSIFSF